MEKLSKIIVLLLMSFSFFIIPSSLSYADAEIKDWDNINIMNDWASGTDHRNDLLNTFWNDSNFFKSRYGWEKGAYYTLVKIAEDLKNLFFLLATIFLLTIVIKVIFWENSEEDIGKFKKWIIWITAWIVVMQAAYAFSKNLYDKNIDWNLAINFTTAIIDPIIWLLEVLASIFFIWIAIFAFFRLVTANWDEESVKTWKMTIIHAIIWFVVIKIARVIVEWVYSKIWWTGSWWVISAWGWNVLGKADPTWFVTTMMQIINWMNGFVWIIVIIMIIFTWFQVLLSAWDEEKLKKAKNSILYIAIWLAILILNWLILTIFIVPESVI